MKVRRLENGEAISKAEWGRRKAEGRRWEGEKFGRWEGLKFGRWEVERVRGEKVRR